MDDIRAVLDAVKSERAALLGWSEGGPMSLCFAATYPERTSRLILFGTRARSTWAPGYTWPEYTEEQWLQETPQDVEAFRRDPSGRIAALVRSGAPDATEDEVAAYVPYFRRGTTPAMYEALDVTNAKLDVRHVLPAVHVPTLVIQHSGDPWS